jgi:hypothetical protein
MQERPKGSLPVSDGVSGMRGLLVGNDQAVAERMRRKRWALVTQFFPQLESMRVLDLGGTAIYWSRAPIKPRHVTVLNLNEPSEDGPGVTAIQGDALDAPDLLRRQFDLVYSNSLIEHLRGHDARLRFADVVTSMAPAYIVQTPYRYFPIEPHWMFPGFQFLPVVIRSYIAPRWPLGHTAGWGVRNASDEVMSTELLSRFELGFYFPTAQIAAERFLGMTKSLFALQKSA